MQQVVSLTLNAGNMGLALEVLPTCQLERRGWSIYYKMICYENNYNMHKMDVQITTVKPDLDYRYNCDRGKRPPNEHTSCSAQNETTNHVSIPHFKKGNKNKLTDRKGNFHVF